MNKTLFQRRQLLAYLGLGVVGAGAAILVPGFLKASPPEGLSVTADRPTAASEVTSGEGIRLPEFQGIHSWLNSAPLTIADLVGSVVLVQFWTFSCINCQRTLPYIVQWHQQYAAQGLKVIGIHTPEFAFEREPNNIRRALQQHQITYPVPIDNAYQTWRAYQNNYWPHLYLADRQGVLRYDHVGEGAYAETEQTIRQLLG